MISGNFDRLHFFDDKGYEIPLETLPQFVWTVSPIAGYMGFLNVDKTPSGFVYSDSAKTEFGFRVTESGHFTLRNIENKLFKYTVIDPETEEETEIETHFNELPKEERLKAVAEEFKYRWLFSVPLVYVLNNEYYTAERAIEYIRRPRSGEVLTEVVPVLHSTRGYETEPDENGDMVPLDFGIEHLVLELEEIEVYGGDTDYGLSNYEYRLLGMSLDENSFDINKELSDFIADVQSMNDGKELWPYRMVLGSYDQSPVSAGLVEANSWFILEENDKKEYVRPVRENMTLVAKILPKGEIRFIENNTEVDYITWRIDYEVPLTEYEGYHSSEVPHGLTIGFITNSEGAFENPVYLYMRDETDGEEYFFGTIMVNSESEGEDERFRTLFTNLGVPDPIDYTQLFKELDPLEEGVDNRLINKKSKELFLSYSEIFPYIGTYKALINSVKFLGYTDIIFKEWYKIYDATKKRSVRVATQIFDSSTGEFLPNPLKRIGVEYGEFLSSKKLNEISMLYLLNQKGGDTDIQSAMVRSEITGHMVRTDLQFDVPWTEPVYDYINTLVLTKLLSLKSWIEKYILGVNAKIIDITGEGVYFGRFKNTVWEFGYETYDFINSTNLTPKFVTGDAQDPSNSLGSAGTSEMKDSSARITCTLNELGKSVINDFKGDRIDSYVTQLGSMVRDKNGVLDYVFNDYNVIDYKPSYRLIEEYQPVSAPLCAVMDTDEFQFELTTDCRESAALQEWSLDPENPLWCHENELIVYDRDLKETKLRPDKLPIFDLEIANIRRPYGNWLYNAEWTIKKVVDVSGYTSYVMQNVGSMATVDARLKTDRHFLLEPIFRETDSDHEPFVTYSQHNKWNLPLLVIGHYTLNPRTMSETIDPSVFDLPKMGAAGKVGEYVLEIVEGVMRFPEVDVESAACFGVKERVRADVNFSDQKGWEPDNLGEEYAHEGLSRTRTREQEIFPTYTYRTERQPLYTFNTTPEGRELIKDELLSIAADAKAYRDAGGPLVLAVAAKRKELLIQFMKDEVLPLFNINTYGYDETHIIDELQELVFDTHEEPTLKAWQKACLNSEGCKELSDKICQNLEYVQDKDLTEFCLTTKMEADLKHFIAVLVNRYNKGTWERWQAFLHNTSIYNLNDMVDMWVNHTGVYRLAVKGFDRHNTTFFNTCGQTLSVCAHRPDIDLYVNSEDSGNETDFFRFNRPGEPTEGDERERMLNPDPYPMFPRLYRVPWFHVGKENGLLTYDSISYVLDTPKRGDIFFVNNFTERCVDIDFGNYVITDPKTGRQRTVPLEKNEMKLIMLDENPCKQNLYIEGASLNVYVYDNRRLEVIYKAKNLTGFAYHKVTTVDDTNYYADSWIAVRFRTEEELLEFLDYRDALRRGEVTFYVGNVTEFEISVENVHNDPETMTSRIEFQIDPGAGNHFNEGDVIKLQYSMHDKIEDDFTRGEYLAQTTHRILEAYEGNIYVIDGLVNERMAWETGLYTRYFTLDTDGSQIPVDENFNEKDYTDPDTGELMGEYEDVPFNMTIRMSRANTEDVQYILDVETDGVEVYENSGYNETHNFQITFSYNNSGWFAGDFMDAGYSGYVTDYDPQDLRDRWSSYTDDTKDVIDLWRYTEFPVSVNEGQLVVLNAVDRAGSFKSFQTEWEWRCRAIGKNTPDPYKNIEEYGTTLFRSSNETVSVVADMYGNNDIKATITDPFGNTVTNPGEGRLFVRRKESED